MMLTLETVALKWILNPNVDSNYTNIPHPQNGSGIIPWYYTTGIIPQLYKHIYTHEQWFLRKNAFVSGTGPLAWTQIGHMAKKIAIVSSKNTQLIP